MVRTSRRAGSKKKTVLGGSVPTIFDWDCRYDASAGPLLGMLGWDRVSISWTKQKAVVMFTTLNKQMPPFIQDMFSVSVRDFYYNIRRSDNILHVPKPSFEYSEAVLWSWLPSELRKPLTLTRFKEGNSRLFFLDGHPHGNTSNSIVDFNYRFILMF